MTSKSTFSNSTSKSYALALYELAHENTEIEKTEDGMKGLNTLLKESKDFKEMISSPTININEKREAIVAISNQNNFPQTLNKFLGFIASKNRLFFLDKIIDSFLNLVSKNKGELKANLISSKKLSAEEQKEISDELSKNFQSPLDINYKHDPSLIGGLVIQVGSIMVDTSIKTQLKKLEKSMLEV